MKPNRKLLLASSLSAVVGVIAIACGGEDGESSSSGSSSSSTSSSSGGSSSSSASSSSGGSSGSSSSSASSTSGTVVTYAVSGKVTGLRGTGLVLVNNNTDELALSAADGGDVSFTFPGKLASQAPYAVTVKTSPASPPQTCEVTNGSGVIGSNEVVNVAVACTNTRYKVGGTVTGLTAGTLVLQNNGADDATIMANGQYSFATPVAFGDDYKVTVKSAPVGLACTVANDTGKVLAAAPVTNVDVTCTPCTGTQTLQATGGIVDFVVPQCSTSLTITAAGAQGGGSNGGKGAQMKGTFVVVKGETLKVVVGARGVVNNCGGGNQSGGGGGGTFVWRAAALDMPMIAAGGGGGGNPTWNGGVGCAIGLDAVTGLDGVKGNTVNSALGGVAGAGGAGNAPSGTGSGGAGWLSDGQNSSFGGGSTGGKSKPTFAGGSGHTASFGPGGQGGFGGGGGAVCGCGGGGGFSGGGAGEGQACRAGGGGGGSYNAGANQVNSAGARSGEGFVTFDW